MLPIYLETYLMHTVVKLLITGRSWSVHGLPERLGLEKGMKGEAAKPG